MTWIKLNDNTPRHPKVAGLSDRAFRVWIQSLCYASEFLTDGVLPPVFVNTVPSKVRAELFAAGLWCINGGGGISIHDYLGHQSSKDEVTRRRLDIAGRVQRFRKRTSNAVTNAVSNAAVTVPEIREQITEVQPPNPLLAKGADIRVRREHREHAKVVLKSRLGYCDHHPPCPNQGVCVEHVAYELAAKVVASC